MCVCVCVCVCVCHNSAGCHEITLWVCVEPSAIQYREC